MNHYLKPTRLFTTFYGKAWLFAVVYFKSVIFEKS